MDYEDKDEDAYNKMKGTYTIHVEGWYKSSLEPFPKYYEKGDEIFLDNVRYFERVK